MTTDQLLTAAISFYDNVGDIDGGYGNRRTRTLLYAQQVYDEIRHHREWPWETTATTGTIPINQSWLLLPSDYEEFGTSGGFFVSANAAPTDGNYTEVEERSVAEVSKLLREQSPGSQTPNFFAIYASLSPTTPGLAINFLPSSSTVAYKLVYSLAPLILVDGGTPAQVMTLPARYHYTVLLPGVVSRMQESKGDARGSWEERYTKGLAEMVRRERPRKTVTQQLPAALDPFYC